MAGWHHANTQWKQRACVVCGVQFSGPTAKKFCSERCKGRWKYVTGKMSTENQYRQISGNWKRYVSRLLYCSGRKRDKLSAEIILTQLEKQNYRCALTGMPLTCELSKGVKTPTNASIDRIIAGGSYTADNIQLVCRAVNLFRCDLPISAFVDWCCLVADHHRKEHVHE